MPERSDLRDYLRPIIARWWLVVLVVGIATVGTYVYSERLPKEYSAATSLFVANSVTDKLLIGADAGPTDRDVANIAGLITSVPVARGVARETGYRGDPRDLLDHVAAKPASDSDFITVTATGPTAALAADRANAFARTYISLREQQQRRDAQVAIGVLRRRIASLPGASGPRGRRSQLQQKIDQLQVVTAANSSGAGVTQINAAVPPASPASPRPLRNALFALVVSLALAVGAAFALDRLETRITRIRDVERAYRVPVLAEVPRARRRLRRSRRELELSRSFREPMRRLRMAVEVAAAEQPIRTLLVTSATPGEGKSTVLSHLAMAYRASGDRVLIADTDVRKPNLDALLRVRREPGLTEVLTGACDLDEVVQSLGTRTTSPAATAGRRRRHAPRNGDGSGNGAAGDGQLAVIASGRASETSLELLGSHRMLGILDELEPEYDIILVDSPPLLAVADTMPLISRVDAVVVVARVGHSTWDAAERLTAELSHVPSARVLGVVANGVPARQHRARSYAYGG